MEQIKSIEELAAKIEESNAAFEAMTSQEKRVEIAKDLLIRLNTKQLKARRGSIVTFRKNLSRGKALSQSLKPLLNTDSAPVCSVCAKGGLFMAYIGRVNTETIQDARDAANNACSAQNGADSKLRDIFSEKMLSYIEMAFEGRQVITSDENYNSIEFTSKEEQEALDFFKTHSKVNDRLIAIAQNIIDNNGDFKL